MTYVMSERVNGKATASVTRDLLLSGEFVSKHKKLLLDAVEAYQAAIVKAGKWSQAILDDPALSILPELKTQIESGSDLEGAPLKLLPVIVTHYQKYLAELTNESWANKDEIELCLSELKGRDFVEDLFGS
jgi:hypothetical protein